MTDDLVAFLRARLDEDEQTARAAKDGPWRADGDSVCATHPTDQVVDYAYDDSAEHIARHDPARVLRDVEAKRRALDEVLPSIEGMEMQIAGEWGVGAESVREASDDLLSLLALPYADHPDYREEWRP